MVSFLLALSQRRSVRALLWCLLALGLGLWWAARTPLPKAQAVVPPTPAQPQQSLPSWQRVAQGDVPMPQGALAAHAATVVPMGPQHPALFTVFWFSGERESGPGVQIAAVQWLRSGQWGPVQTVLNRHVLGAQLGFGIRRLGNPVAWRDADGRLHLWVVATGAGGWAASRVLHVRQRQIQGALEFDPVAVLPLSWWANTSFLVRNAVLPLGDGGVLLPLHFEIGAKISALARLDAQGRLVGLQRLSQRRHVLQPALLTLSPSHWRALMRDESERGRIAAVETLDGGQHWSDLPDLDLPNPDASVATLGWGPGHHLLAYNPVRSGRDRLALAQSRDGVQWQVVDTVAQGASEDEFSYPALARMGDELWMVYTVDRARLAWQRWVPQAHGGRS